MHINERVERRKEAGNLRKLQVIEGCIDFSSNDYLGLARSPELIAAIKKEWEGCQVGAGGSRLLTGNSPYVEELEARLAAFHGYEAGLLFNCGYMANIGLLSTIAGEKDTILFDAHIHASMRDGMRLSKAKSFPFRHNDLTHLEERLRRAEGDRYICVESVYSTDGSIAPLKEIAALAKKVDVKLIVDEAHAVGVFGPEGKGLVAEEGLCDTLFAQVTTFGKAPGVEGAIVLGSKLVKEALINFATSFIYTTGLSFLSLASIKCSYDLFPKMEKERTQLRHLSTLFTQGAKTPIQSIAIPGNEKVKGAAKKIRKEGFDVRALTSPTVRRGSERLRICLHAFNTTEEVKALLERLTH